jgi:hypothetical protein
MLFQASIEDYLYIVLGIVWIAYSIYKGTQKSRAKQTKNDSSNQEPKKKSAFETFFDEILVEEKPTPYAPEAEIQSSYETVEEKTGAVDEALGQENIFSYDDYYEESNLPDDIEVYDDKADIQIEKKQKAKATPSSRIKKPRIDLRKAVVYSEILNKRYF